MSRARPGSKGRVERDVAEEAARQVWGARELLLRLGFDAEQIVVKAGVPLGAHTEKRIELRMLESAVELRLPMAIPAFAIEFGDVVIATDGTGGQPTKHVVRTFQIGCGPVPTIAMLNAAVVMRVKSIQAGTFSEEELLRAFHASSAYGGRFEIVAALAKKKFPLPIDWEAGLAPAAAGSN